MSHQALQSVPWFSSKEWKTVFELVFGPGSNDECKKEALQILLVWKARCPVLPSGIESTLGFLEVELQSPFEDVSSNIPDRLLRLMYSSVIMRFINHMLDDAQSKGLTLLQAALEMNIPQWIVNLRHETAHGHELPSLILLKNATHYAMNWLFNTYWAPHNELISDYESEEVEHYSDEFEHHMSQLIYYHNLLAVFCYPKFEIKKLCGIPDKDLRDDLYSFLSQIFVKSKLNFDLNTKIKVYLQLVVKEIEKVLVKSQKLDKNDYFIKVFLNNESLFLTTNINFSESIKKKNKLSRKYITTWEPMLTLMYKRNMITKLIEHLINLVECENQIPARRKICAQWIKEICIGLHKSRIFQSIPHEHLLTESQGTLLQYLIHHHPNQKDGLTFDLLQPVPSELSSVKFVHNTIKNFNPYLRLYAKEIIALADSKISESCATQLLDLVDIISGSAKLDSVISDKIYTLNDLDTEIPDSTSSIKEIVSPNLSKNKSSENSTLDSTSNSLQANNSGNNVMINNHWEIASSDIVWKNFPIGILPWQTQNRVNPTFSFKIHN